MLYRRSHRRAFGVLRHLRAAQLGQFPLAKATALPARDRAVAPFDRG